MMDSRRADGKQCGSGEGGSQKGSDVRCGREQNEKGAAKLEKRLNDYRVCTRNPLPI